jgi:hypothetical protein
MYLALKSVNKVLCDLYSLSRLAVDFGYKKTDFGICRASRSDYVGAKGEGLQGPVFPWGRVF